MKLLGFCIAELFWEFINGNIQLEILGGLTSICNDVRSGQVLPQQQESAGR